MNKFLIKIFVFFILVTWAPTASLFFIPGKTAQNSLLAALVDKHSILEQTTSPKIIFIGGSNLSFGLNSRRIAERFDMSVVNMSLHGGIGLMYMINDTKPYIKKGDLIVLSPEYGNFYKDTFYGDIELVSILFDIYPEGRKHISFDQWAHLSKYIVKYSRKKIESLKLNNPCEDFQNSIGIYDKESFNEYGDAYIHWNLPNEPVEIAQKCSGKEIVNNEVILFLKNFNEFVTAKGANMVILPPVFQASSYDNLQHIIDLIEVTLKKNDLPLIAECVRYKFPDSYFFNTSYHLNKGGVEKRTGMVIEDLSQVIEAD